MGALGTSQRVFLMFFVFFFVVFGLFFAMLAFFDGLRKGRRAKRASKASERSSLVLLALVLKLIFGRLNSMPGLVSIFMLFWWFLVCFLLFWFFFKGLSKGSLCSFASLSSAAGVGAGINFWMSELHAWTCKHVFVHWHYVCRNILHQTTAFPCFLLLALA